MRIFTERLRWSPGLYSNQGETQKVEEQRVKAS